MQQLHLFPAEESVPALTMCMSRKIVLRRADSLVVSPGSLAEETPTSSTESFTSFADRLSVDSLCSPEASSPTSYYDIPLPESPTQAERNICRYLEQHQVHMSHPEAKKSQVRAPQSSSPVLGAHRKASVLLERRRSMYIKQPVVAAVQLNTNN